MKKNIENELRNLVDAEYENLEGLSKEEFYSWSAGLIDNLTRDISDKIYIQSF